MKVKAEYIWLDNTNGVHSNIRSKTKIVELDTPLPIWDDYMVDDFGDLVKIRLQPIKVYKDIKRGDNSYVVLCEVMNENGEPHQFNFRAKLTDTNDCHFGFEQEYVLLDPSTGKSIGLPSSPLFTVADTGNFYSGVGTHRVRLRDLAEEHLDMCLGAGIDIVGVNSEVMIGQWEYQIGHSSTPHSSCDDLIVSRYLLERLSESYGVIISYKPIQLHYPFCHINVSSKQMVNGINQKMVFKIERVFSQEHRTHLKEFGEDNSDRFGGVLTPNHETCDVGVNDKSVNINIIKEKNYIEDRRPPANINPYKACGLLIETINKIFN